MLGGVPDRPEHLQSMTRRQVRRIGGGHLRRGDVAAHVGALRGSAVDADGRAVNQRPCHLQRDGDIGQMVLDGLEGADGATELLARHRVLRRDRQHPITQTEQLGGGGQRAEIGCGSTVHLGGDRVGPADLGDRAGRVHRAVGGGDLRRGQGAVGEEVHL